MKQNARSTVKSKRHLTRREFLRITGGTAITLPYLFGSSSCALRNVGIADTATGISLCCMSGDVTSHGATVWLRAAPGSHVAVHYGTDPTLRDFSTTPESTVDSGTDYTAKIELQGLQAGTTYYYRPAVTGKKPGPIARFLTAPRPDDLTPVRFCFSGDSREGYQPFTIMDSICSMEPHFFLHLGDTIYADIGGRASRLPDFWAKYRANRHDFPSQRLFRETSAYVIWDDHEVENDYEPGHPLMPIGRQAFLDYWPIQRNPDDAHRLYRSFRWGKGAELFILDTRQYRNRVKGTMLGREQKRWLFEGLASSTAQFKFIATSVQLSGIRRDGWFGFPAERDELIRRIANEKIKGVVFLSADVHYAAVSRIPGSFGLKEVTAGPIGAPMNVITNGNASRFEFWSNETFNYAMITVDPRSSTPQAFVEFFDEDSRSLYKTRIDAV